MTHFTCETCQNVLYFENSICLNCGHSIGFDPETRQMVTLGPDSPLMLCQNGVDYGVCNWLLPKSGGETFCVSCQLNHKIPDLSFAENKVLWAKMEVAKRRVLYTLSELGLRPHSKMKGDDGLIFEFLKPTPQEPVLTGHDNGVIVLNLDEADDSHREQMRTKLGEPYRTLLGHFRHEIGHYYWDQLLKTRDQGDFFFREWRSLFGDETYDYDAALQRHYKQGPPANWALTYISSYATMHPWEDWAETWAHYLHIIDGMETAHDFGWDGENIPINFQPFTAADIGLSERETDPKFLTLVNTWAKLAPALNEISLSLGQGSLFPFVFTAAAVRKIHFVHLLVKDGMPGRQRTPPGELATEKSDETVKLEADLVVEKIIEKVEEERGVATAR